MAKATMSKDEIIEAIGSMSVLELAEMVKDMEEKFGVTAAAPMMAAPAAGGAAPAATEHDVPVGIAGGLNNRRHPVRVDSDEVMRRAAGDHRIDGDLQAAFRPVLEPNRHGEPAGHFAMRLAFGRSGPDGRPT